jgi:glycosyltransferase involved in cell wall biosynthesis
MSVGLPAIVTDVGGMAEVVKNAGAGLATPIADPSAMAEAILQLASDPTRRRALSENARAAYQQHFTLERMAASYMELYIRHS